MSSEASSTQQTNPEDSGDQKPAVIDLETIANAAPKEPEPIPEEPFVPEEEPTEKTWLGKREIFEYISSFLHSFLEAPVIYSLQMLLPDFTKSVGSYIDVNIAADYLTSENTGLTSKALWGNHIYTDDSDVVAGRLGSTRFLLARSISNSLPFLLIVVLVHSDKYKLTEKKPDHDLRVTLRVLEKKEKYPSAKREGVTSREWQDHDGVSFRVTNCQPIKSGEALRRLKRGRKQDLTVFSKRKAVMESPPAPQKFVWTGTPSS